MIGELKLDQHHSMSTTAEWQVRIHCFVNRCMTATDNKYPGAIQPLLLPAVHTTPMTLCSCQAGYEHFKVARLRIISPCMASIQTAYAMFTWAAASSSFLARHARVWHTAMRWHKVCKTEESRTTQCSLLVRVTDHPANTVTLLDASLLLLFPQNSGQTKL